MLNGRIFQYLSKSEAVAAAQHKNALWFTVVCGERWVNQRFVIAVFIERVELQVAVQKKCVSGLSFRNDYALIRRALGVDDVVRKQTVFRQGGQAFGFNKSYRQDD